jgi:hypothetical protein
VVEHERGLRLLTGMDGCARAGEPVPADRVRRDADPDEADVLRLRLPATTATVDGEPLISQVESVYRVADLPAAERRGRSTAVLLPEYDALVAAAGADAPALVDGPPRTVHRVLHGVLNDRTGNLASVYPLTPAGERRARGRLPDASETADDLSGER